MQERRICKLDITERIQYVNGLKPGQRLVNPPPLKETDICKAVDYPDHLEPQLSEYNGDLDDWGDAWKVFWKTAEYQEFRAEMTNDKYPQEVKPCL